MHSILAQIEEPLTILLNSRMERVGSSMQRSTLPEFDTAWKSNLAQRTAPVCVPGFCSAACGKVSVPPQIRIGTEQQAALMSSGALKWLGFTQHFTTMDHDDTSLISLEPGQLHDLNAAAWVLHATSCRESKGSSWKPGHKSHGIMHGYSSPRTGTAFLHGLKSR